MADPITQGAVGLVGGLFSSSQAQRESNRQYARQEQLAKETLDKQTKLAEPYVNASGIALPKLQSAADTYLARSESENPYLTAGLKKSLTSIQRQQSSEVNNAQMQFGSSGNAGAAWGATLRANRAATDAGNNAQLGYGQAQQSYKQQNYDKYTSVLDQLNQIGMNGVSMASNALGNYGQTMGNISGNAINSSNDMWGGVASLFEPLTARGLDAYDSSRLGVVNSNGGGYNNGPNGSGYNQYFDGLNYDPYANKKTNRDAIIGRNY